MLFCEEREVDAGDLVRLKCGRVGTEAEELELAAHLGDTPSLERHSEQTVIFE
jgi:hypothetical protein